MRQSSNNARVGILGLAAAALAMSGMAVLSGPQFDISWHTIDAGGGIVSGGSFELHGTIGQPDAGPLLTGGAFEVRGGLWAGGGSVGSPAMLTDLAVVFGTLDSGDLSDLTTSDDQRVVFKSQFGFSAQESNIVQFVVGATTTSINGTSLNISIESRLNNPGGNAKVALKNFSTAQFEQVHEYAIGQTETIEEITNVGASNRIRNSDGRIELQVKQSVIATFSASGFDTVMDWIEIVVE